MPKTGTGGAPPLFDIRIGESFIAGVGDLVVERDTAPCQVDIERSALALSGSILSVFGSDDSRAEDAEIAFNIEHATCILGRGFLHMDSGALPRYLLPVTVNARNNIFAAGAAGQFVSMTKHGPRRFSPPAPLGRCEELLRSIRNVLVDHVAADHRDRKCISLRRLETSARRSRLRRKQRRNCLAASLVGMVRNVPPQCRRRAT
jgi:hypothetical protein